jgi:hypothetical protein
LQFFAKAAILDQLSGSPILRQEVAKSLFFKNYGRSPMFSKVIADAILNGYPETQAQRAGQIALPTNLIVMAVSPVHYSVRRGRHPIAGSDRSCLAKYGAHRFAFDMKRNRGLMFQSLP